jgi:hypothetical protein
MRTYEVSLQQVSNPRNLDGTPNEDPLPDSPQLSGSIGCEQGVAFGNVRIGAGYVASIVAFDQDASVPRWSGSCDPIEADYQALRHVRNCKLTDARPSETKVELSLDAATTGQQCGDVTRYELIRDGEVTSAECGETVTFTMLDAGTPLEVDLLAFAGDSDAPILGGHCFARAALGATVKATCGTLESKGGIEVPLQTVAEAFDASTCSDLTRLAVTLDDSMSTAIDVVRLDPQCKGSVRFSAVEPGEHTLSVSVERAGEALSASCSAEVRPGLVARPSCDAG